MIPSRDLTLLPENNAAYSRNTWLYRGNIQGYKSPLTRYNLTTSAQSVYRIPLGSATDYAGSKWVELSDIYTNVLWSPVVADQYNRYYFFSPSGTPQYSPLSDIQSGVAKLTLGVPTPTITPYITEIPAATKPTNPISETRSYVYTWVTVYGEEGAPSPPGIITGTVGSTYSLTLTAPTSQQLANRRISQVRIYRTITDAAGTANYYLVATLNYTSISFIDSTLDTSISSNNILESNYWTPPPALQGCVLMPNGIMAGWANDNEVWFSEPYRPHAWPATYAISVPYRIVGLGVINSSLIIATEGSPYIATGITPESMSLSEGPMQEPCISRNSIVSAPEGVYYASANGLILVTTGGAQNVTKQLLTREDWGKLNPSTFVAGRYGSAYVAFTRNTSLGNGSGDNGIVIDNSGPNVAFNNLRFNGAVKNVVQDAMTGNLFIVSGTTVTEWDAQAATTQQPYIWRSKVFQMPYKREFVAALIYFDVPTSVTITPTEATRNTAQPQTFDATKQYFLLRVYADNRLVMTREVIKSGELIMLPSGFKANFYQFEVEGQVVISNIQVATSVKELRSV